MLDFVLFRLEHDHALKAKAQKRPTEDEDEEAAKGVQFRDVCALNYCPPPVSDTGGGSTLLPYALKKRAQTQIQGSELGQGEDLCCSA